PSLCAGLTVREVLAHLTAGASDNPLVWFAGVLRHRFDFDANVAQRLAKRLGDRPADTLEQFRAVRTSRTKAPIPVGAMLGEIVVHGE
ncbi:maleylpyruvate isomerase N-terminal domain-containing protein, partial [Mycobacterium kansasii]